MVENPMVNGGKSHGYIMVNSQMASEKNDWEGLHFILTLGCTSYLPFESICNGG